MSHPLNLQTESSMASAIPIRYIEPVFRPPSEGNSLILPVTDGCSWNQCTFCEMYTAPQKKFRAREEAEVLESIRRAGETFGDCVRRVFLADGDALVLPSRRLLRILQAIKQHLPAVERVSSYCLPRNLKRKSAAELSELHEAGLKMAYVGAESGDDRVLEKVNKCETFASTVDALDKLAQAGITRSVMILNGLGGQVYSDQHARNSARLANATQPEFLATLVVSFPMGEARFRAGFPEWEPLDQTGLFREMEQLLDQLELENTVFRSDHASNWLVLKGRLGADKQRLLGQVRAAIARPESAPLRPAWARGL
ncbi:MAG: radical SAM protein [Wenzhouxiangella sp.]